MGRGGRGLEGGGGGEIERRWCGEGDGGLVRADRRKAKH